MKDEESLYQYHLECSNFDCIMKPETAVITIIEAYSVEEIRDKDPKCGVCGSELTNSKPGMIGAQLPVVQIN